MSTNSDIEWCDHTWPLISGCHPRSPGCAKCWAVRMSWRLSHNPVIASDYAGTVEKVGRSASGQLIQVQVGHPGRLRWSGRVNMLSHRLNWPMTKKWKPGSKIFVSDMADLCSPEVTDEFILDVFRVMLQTPQFIYQLLTKDPDRLVALSPRIGALVEEYGGSAARWPGHLWFGTSVENPAMYWRIDELRKLPAAIRYISAEPLLKQLSHIPLQGIHWIIAGCESGPGARLMDEAWVEQLLDDTKQAGGAFFYKQRLDERGHKVSKPKLGGQSWTEFPLVIDNYSLRGTE